MKNKVKRLDRRIKRLEKKKKKYNDKVNNKIGKLKIQKCDLQVAIEIDELKK